MGHRIVDSLNCVRYARCLSWCKLQRMDPLIFPVDLEFASAEEAEEYDRWFRAKVQAGSDDPRPDVPHEEAMARMRALLAAKLNKAESDK